jgi:hypothetical protein
MSQVTFALLLPAIENYDVSGRQITPHCFVDTDWNKTPPRIIKILISKILKLLHVSVQKDYY